MKVLKVIANVIGVLLALVLSLALFVALITAPVVSAIGSFMQTDTLKKVVENVDYNQLFNEIKLEESMAGGDFDPELIAALMESGMAADIVEIYAEGMFDMLEGKTDEIVISAEEMNDILQSYLDEIVPMVKEMIGDQYPVPDEMIRSMTSEMLKEYSAEIAGVLPSAADLGLTDEVIIGVTMLRDGTVLMGVIGVIGVLSILILLCRIVRFKGFMWLGVVYLLCGILNFLASTNMGDALESVLVAAESGVGAVVTPIINIMATEMMKGAGVLAGLAVLFIVVFVVGRNMLRKRNEKLQSAVEV